MPCRPLGSRRSSWPTRQDPSCTGTARLFGYAPEEVLGQTLDVIAPEEPTYFLEIYC
jgi:hypothetical protein